MNTLKDQPEFVTIQNNGKAANVSTLPKSKPNFSTINSGKVEPAINVESTIEEKQTENSSYMIPIIIAGIICSCIFNKSKKMKIIDIIFTHKYVEWVAHVGFLWLMYIAGLSVHEEIFEGDLAKSTYIIAITGIIIPFTLTFGIMYFGMSYDIKSSILTAIVLSITAEAATTVALKNNNIENTLTGSLVLGAGLIDDTFGLLSYIIFSILCNCELNFIGVGLPILALVLFVIGYFTKTSFLQNNIVFKFTSFVFLFFIGYNANVKYFLTHPHYIILFLLILIIGIIGKYGGVFLGFSLVKNEFTKIEKQIIAWGMNSRGIVGMVIVLSALRYGIIDRKLYTTLLVASVVTTIMFPVALYNLRKKQKTIR